MPSPPITPMRYGDVFTPCGWCRKRDEHARRGRPRVCLRKRRNDLPELILGEGPERLRRDVAKRGCRDRPLEPRNRALTKQARRAPGLTLCIPPCSLAPHMALHLVPMLVVLPICGAGASRSGG